MVTTSRSGTNRVTGLRPGYPGWGRTYPGGPPGPGQEHQARQPERERRRRERQQALARRRRTWLILAGVVGLWVAFQLVFYFVVPWLG